MFKILTEKNCGALYLVKMKIPLVNDDKIRTLIDEEKIT
jgi:hypothetical protein